MAKVLVVDDKEMMRDSVATMLARKGHGVVVANGGPAALEKIASSSCDAVITDLQMPDMTGVAAWRTAWRVTTVIASPTSPFWISHRRRRCTGRPTCVLPQPITTGSS